MKKNFLHWAMLLTAGLGLVMASCSDSKDEEEVGPVEKPVFPEAVEATVIPGDNYALNFETNMKWEASIPESASQNFYIADGEHKVLTQSGEAGQATVVIGTYEVESFDEAPACEVTLTVGTESKVIATLTIKKQERVLALYTSKMDGGGFAYSAEEGLRYAYNEEPAQTVELVWPEGLSGYLFPIMVEANFAWRLAEKSDWIAEEEYKGEAGEKVEILLKADPTKYPLDGDKEGKFVLCARNNPDQKYAYTVTIPACRDYYNVSGFVAESRFNAEGQFFNASGSSWVNQGMHGYIMSVEEPVIFKFAEVAGALKADAAQTEWIKVETEASGSDANNVLKERRYTISVEKNTGEARKGVVLALPKSEAEKIADPSELAGTEIKEEYRKYVLTTLSQASGIAVEFVEFVEPPMADYTLTELPKNEFPYEGNWSAVPVIYNLTYTTEMDGEMAELKFNVPYDSYEVYGEEGPYAQSQLDPRWADLADGYNGDNCKMVKIACTYEDGSFVWTYDKPVNPTAYFVFKNEGEIVGIIEFKFEEKQQGGGTEISLAQGNSDGVALVQLASGDTDYDSDFGSMGVPQYKLTLTGTPMAYLNLPEYDESTYYEDDELISIFPAGNFHMLMYNSDEAGKTQIVFKSSWMNTACLIVEYKPE